MGDEESQGRNAISVSDAMGLAKGALEGVVVKILGEVSELSNKAGYKAVYFTIKDDRAALPCMMWNNRYAACGVDLRIGSLVEITGRFTLYAAKGRMNFDVFSIALAGEGNLRLQVANLAKKLEAEGLMNPLRKKPLPYLPQKVGLVTSPRGAAVYDVLRTLRRRNPMIEVCVAGVPVEGAVAPAALVGGLEACVQAGVDVILLVRGGGSFEDLMPFNDESLARAVAACPVPVVTGIGHEPDTSIADMVSDFRASTPTAAAEAVAVSRDEIANVVEGMGLAARSALERQMSDYRTRLRMAEASGLFKNPMSVLAQPAHALDYCKHHLQTAMAGLCPMRRQRLDFAKGRLKSYGAGLIPKYKGAVNGLGHTFTASPKTVLARYSAVIGMDCARLEDLSPLKTLSRGYSVTKTSDGRVVKSVAGLSEGDILSTIVSDGCIDAKIERVKREEISVEFLEV